MPKSAKPRASGPRPVRVSAPAAGWLTGLEQVPDPVFAQGMLGTGVAIDPVEGMICAPCDGIVTLIAPTRHAVTLLTDDGAEIVIHIGLETVGLDGQGFEAQVEQGARVAAGDRLLSFDLDAVGLKAKSLITPILLTGETGFRFVPGELDRIVAVGDPIGTIEATASGDEQVAASGPAETARYVVGLDHGLHARPAARIAECAKRFDVEVSLQANGRTAAGRSPVAIMALDVRKGDEVVVHAQGPEAGAVLECLADVLGPAPETAAPEAPAPAAGDTIGGVCAMAGSAVGSAFQWRRAIADPPEHGEDPAKERAALSRALSEVRGRLETLSASSGGPAKEIAQAHLSLLDDEGLHAAADASIDKGKSAGFAWRSAIAGASSALDKTGNRHMRERVADLEDIASQVVRALDGSGAEAALELPERTILLADDLLPSELLAIDRERIAGIAIAGGGPTSHIAIIAASFGVPTLVGMGPSVTQIPTGTRLLLDAMAGRLVVEPTAEAASTAAARPAVWSDAAECCTADGERITLLANLGGLGDVASALAAGAEGCGLLRTEFLFLDRAEAPGEDEQLAAYQGIADALGGRPLTIRTLDIGGDKPVAFIEHEHEDNPALGLRGIRTALARPDLLETQLRAISRVSGPGIKAMIPMLSSIDELRAVRARVGSAKLGVMVETPAAAVIADALAAEADFLSIGSNDLAQYALAMDRTNPALAPYVDALHPAVLRLIAMTVEAAAKVGKPVSLCGGLASDQLGALVLVGLGLRELSAVPAALPAVRGAIGSASVEDCAALARQALAADSASEVRRLAAALLQGGNA